MQTAVALPDVDKLPDRAALLDGSSELIDASPHDRSRYPLPDYPHSIVALHDLAGRPFLDEAALAEGTARPTWPGGAPFAMCLTHDVDFVALNSARHYLRQMRAAAQHARRGAGRRAWKTALLRATEAARACVRRGDPLFCLERWLELEAKYNARSTFYFLPDRVSKPHWTDGGYRYHDRVVFDGTRCTVAEMMREIRARGWEVGLHAAWNAYNDAAEMRRQVEQVAEAARCDVVSVRHHYLHFDPAVTPAVQAAAGLKYDSSVGFNLAVGFRRGTCWPWELTKTQTGEPLGLVEIPLIYQDSSALSRHKGLRLSYPEAIRYAERLMSRVADVSGVFTASWHPNNLTRPLYWQVYEHVLQFGKQQNAYFGTAKQVGDAWSK